jgi:hypothetical protein
MFEVPITFIRLVYILTIGHGHYFMLLTTI